MLKQIENRRCCRKFDPNKEVETEKINEVINAGLYAASAKNQQNSIIFAITNKETRNKLSKLNAFIEGMDPFYGAPVVLLVASKKNPFAQLDGAAMLENMMIEANNQGLAACWIHRAKEELESSEGKELFSSLNIDLDEYEGIGHVILGYPLDFKYQEKQIKPNRVFYIK